MRDEFFNIHLPSLEKFEKRVTRSRMGPIAFRSCHPRIGSDYGEIVQQELYRIALLCRVPAVTQHME